MEPQCLGSEVPGPLLCDGFFIASAARAANFRRVSRVIPHGEIGRREQQWPQIRNPRDEGAAATAELTPPPPGCWGQTSCPRNHPTHTTPGRTGRSSGKSPSPFLIDGSSSASLREIRVQRKVNMNSLKNPGSRSEKCNGQGHHKLLTEFDNSSAPASSPFLILHHPSPFQKTFRHHGHDQGDHSSTNQTIR